MAYHYSKKINLSFNDAVAKVTETLKQQGFGIITSIDMKDTLRQKLNIAFRNYKILGACNPQFAYKALTRESHVGVMLPCNIVVQQHENGEVEVSAINPMETLDLASLNDIVEEVSSRLRAAIDDLYRDSPEPKRKETLPP